MSSCATSCLGNDDTDLGAARTMLAHHEMLNGPAAGCRSQQADQHSPAPSPACPRARPRHALAKPRTGGRDHTLAYTEQCESHNQRKLWVRRHCTHTAPLVDLVELPQLSWQHPDRNSKSIIFFIYTIFYNIFHFWLIFF